MRSKNQIFIEKSKKYCEEFKASGVCSQENSCYFKQFHQKCIYFERGNCAKENTCPYFHEIKNNNTKGACPFYNKGNCRFGSNCRYLHVCSFFMQDKCKNGQNCLFSHQNPSSIPNTTE